MTPEQLRSALEAHPETIHAGAPRSPSDRYCLARIDDVIELVYPPGGVSTPTPDPGVCGRRMDWCGCGDAFCTAHDQCPNCAAIEQLGNEAQIERLTLPAGEWRVSVGVDGTRTVTPLEPTHWECTWVNPISGRGCGIYECDGGHYVEIDGRHVWRYHSGRPTAWADAPKNGDSTK